MRMILPPVRVRREIDGFLEAFFRSHETRHFRRAMVQMSRYYALATPRVTWFEYLDWGKTGGRTFENGEIHLVHPENWKRGRKYNSERRWVNLVYHEMGHYIFWTDAERKADTFASRMVRGLSVRRAALAMRGARGAGRGVAAQRARASRRTDGAPGRRASSKARGGSGAIRDRVGERAVAAGRNGRRRTKATKRVSRARAR